MAGKTKTISEVRADFARKGIAISDWARKQGLDIQAVYDLINGRSKGTRGDAHKAAVKLGLKEGEIVDDRTERRGAA